MSKVKKSKFLWLLLVLAIFVLTIVIYAVPSFMKLFENTVIVKYGNLTIDTNTQAYFIRDEVVYLADRSGKVKYKAREGDKLRRGSRILTIEGDGSPSDQEGKSKYTEILEMLGSSAVSLEDNTAQHSGTVGYNIDGYENYFIPSKIKNIKKTFVESMEIDVLNVKNKKVKSGDPIYKMVDNNKWYLLFWIKNSPKERKKYELENSVNVDFGDSVVVGIVDQVIEEDDYNKIVIKFDRYYKDFATKRNAKVRVIVADYQGLVIDNISIGKKNGQDGVYVKKKNGDFVFTPVNIKVTDGKYSIVSTGTFLDNSGNTIDTINYYEEILYEFKK